jgi:uncharacterized membrane protein YvlD (DUF360 family)
MSCNVNLITAACLVGFLGDGGLQILVRKGMGKPDGWGLTKYFQQHGSSESMFIAGGMLSLFYIIYLVFLRLPVKWYYLAIYGIVLDLIFRITMWFPSLKGYYRHMNYFWSALWGAIPMVLPLLIVHTMNYIRDRRLNDSSGSISNTTKHQ